jgi:D-alanine-D-alanine ligase
LVFQPIEFVFPEGESFKTYQLKITEYHPEKNIKCNDPLLSKKLMESAKKIFIGFEGIGYARMDFRVDDSNTVYFLEINSVISLNVYLMNSSGLIALSSI